MLAALYVGNETFRLEQRELRSPGPDEVRVEVAYVGICGTDLHIKHGAMDGRVAIPAVLGHQMSGTVAAVGEGCELMFQDPVSGRNLSEKASAIKRKRPKKAYCVI